MNKKRPSPDGAGAGQGIKTNEKRLYPYYNVLDGTGQGGNMKGSLKITLNYLKELGACRDGQREFQRAFPDGGEYQDVLDRCAEEGRLDFANWLFDRIGPTEDIRRYDEKIDSPDKNIFFAGNIVFASVVSVRGIFSGCGIEAGWGIKAGEGIEAGEDFCIFAGLCVRKSLWMAYAIVTASTKPDNLISGVWKPLEGNKGEAS